MEGSLQDKLVPKERWQFNESVTACFDDMLERSIPQYAVMRKACFDIGSEYLRGDTYILDIGCSRGEAIAPFVEAYRGKYRYYGLEASEPMVNAARARFYPEIKEGLVNIEQYDLRWGIPEVDASLVLSVLTLQFTPIEYRLDILQAIYNALRPGGALILVEKVLGRTKGLNRLFVDTYHAAKSDNGYTDEQIARKKLSLEGVLVPVTAKWNEDLLLETGFKEVDCFWRWMNFAGWVAVK